MPSSTPTSVTRYRPAILLVTGAAAAYAAYLAFTAFDRTPNDALLRRSNAVRRRLRRRRSATAPPLSLTLANDSQSPELGDYDLFGTRVRLSTNNLVPASDLRDIITSSNPGASAESVESGIAEVYDAFLDRLFASVFRGRSPSPIEIDAIRLWISDRIPDNTAVVRAAERHVQSLPPGVAAEPDGAESVAHTDLTWGSDEDTEGDNIDSDGQSLQRTLYHIAEDRARQEGVLHRGITCNACDEKPIRGVRWHCANCVDFDLCSNCEATNSHYKTHIFYKIRVPAPYLGLPKQEPLYPGKPHMMSPSIDPALKKRLVSETKMEAEEVEALWDQFTCLAGTEWTGDTSGVGWALDRRAFNLAFVPRYDSFVASPNLIYDRIFAYYDTDNNGYIGFDEWIKGLDGMHTTDVDVKARIIFDGYDIDGDGYLSRKDILRIFRAYYAVEKEATRNYVAELGEELSVRNALDTIRSSQPLGSAFPPTGTASSSRGNPRLRQKQNGDLTGEPVLADDNMDVANRDDILKTTNLYNLAPGELSPGEQNRIITDRWARRQFYIDEEEGLTRSGDDEDAPPADEPSFGEARLVDAIDGLSQEDNRPRLSRSSSRVRFQDDVEFETRSNTTTSSKALGDRWGGYEIPEMEKDLGKEVLYQITQQGFNELLDPLFQEKEDMAMDAFETRDERRKHAAMIDQDMEILKASRESLDAIRQVGIFRYSKCVMDEFCKAFDKKGHSNMENFLQNGSGNFISQDEAKSALVNAYTQVEQNVVNSIKRAKITQLDTMTLWNTWLCRDQLREEVVTAFMECVLHKGWISQPNLDDLQCQHVPPKENAFTYRDPTMPQFRPNSLADAAVSTSVSETASTASESDVEDEVAFYNQVGTEHMVSHPRGPFFVHMALGAENPDSNEEMTTDDKEGMPPATHVNGVSSSEPEEVVPETTHGAGSEVVINWRSYTDNPDFHILFWEHSNGVDVIRYSSKPIIHSMNPFLPETNPVKPLQRRIRQLAMDPNSVLHNIMLASLETVEQEMRERKGSGLINFEEFVEHTRQGKMRFLESWREWVSI